MSSASLAAPLRAALIANTTITGALIAYNSSFPIFTTRPAPVDAPFPLIMVSPDLAIADDDGINDFRPVQEVDISVFGKNDLASKVITVEDIAREVREMFHRQRAAITVSGWHVIQIVCRGPRPGPTDDENEIARIVSLSVQLARQA